MHKREEGQVLVLAALFIFFVLITTLGLIVDGGTAYAHQRMAQNGADAAADSGAVALGQWITHKTGSIQDPEVLAAVRESAQANSLEAWEATYTDVQGDPLPGPVTVGQAAGGSIPPAARGVQVVGQRSGEATFARIIGMNTITASANATAVVGKLAGCSADSPCGLLPVTFPVSIATCGEPHQTYFLPNNPFPNPDGLTWPTVPLDEAVSPSGNDLMASIPLCTTQDSGAVGWLDLTDGTNLEQEIRTPYQGSIDIPTWLHTQQGNVNSVEDALNAYAGKVVLIPMWDGLCASYPGSPVGSCVDPQQPNGDNTWYHIPQFASFKIYQAYIQGNDSGASGPCTSSPGIPLVAPGTSGFVGCIKGWFTDFITEGPINFEGEPAEGDSLGIQLIK